MVEWQPRQVRDLVIVYATIMNLIFTVNYLEQVAQLRQENQCQTPQSVSPAEVQVVDELLGSPIASRAPTPGTETTRTPKILAPKEAPKNHITENEDERSVAMDLETDSGSLTLDTPIASNLGRRVSGEMNGGREAEVEEPPRKRQRIEDTGAFSSKILDSEEVKMMEGESYSKILSGTLFASSASSYTEPDSVDYCLEYGRPQPQVTYQRHRVDTTDTSSFNYHVSLVVGNARYELSKNYEKVQEAEEKLSKRILKLFGVKPKKVRVDEV